MNRFESTISTENCELTAKYNQFSDSNLHSNFNSQKSSKHKNKQMIKSKSRSNMRNSNLQKLSMKPRMFEAKEYLRGLSKLKQFQTDKLYNSKVLRPIMSRFYFSLHEVKKIFLTPKYSIFYLEKKSNSIVLSQTL